MGKFTQAEIDDFICRAQGKLAELGDSIGCSIAYGHDEWETEYSQIREIKDFLDGLTSSYQNWTDQEIYTWINYISTKYDISCQTKILSNPMVVTEVHKCSTTGNGTDEYVSAVSLVGTTLTLTRAVGDPLTVDLSSLQSTDEYVNSASLVGTTLTLGRAVGADLTVDLSSLSASELTVGIDNQIPFVNTAGDDFEYNAYFTFNGARLVAPNIAVDNINIDGNTINTLGGDLIFDAITDISFSSNRLQNVLDPTNPQDAATKAYVDANVGNPAGANTQIQYNNSGSFGASSSFTWNNATGSNGRTLTLVSDGTAANGRVYLDGTVQGINAAFGAYALAGSSDTTDNFGVVFDALSSAQRGVIQARAENPGGDAGSVPVLQLVSNIVGGISLATRPLLGGYNDNTLVWQVNANGNWDYQGNELSNIDIITLNVDTGGIKRNVGTSSLRLAGGDVFSSAYGAMITLNGLTHPTEVGRMALAIPDTGYFGFYKSSAILSRMDNTGQWRFHNYGVGTFTGTATQYLAVDASGNIIEETAVAATPAGADTQIQFNDGGSLGASSNLTFTSDRIFTVAGNGGVNTGLIRVDLNSGLPLSQYLEINSRQILTKTTGGGISGELQLRGQTLGFWVNAGATQSATVAPNGDWDFQGNQLKNISDPTLAQDAATKAYVDAQSGVTENSFTPVLSFGGDSTGITYSTQLGYYHKVGNQVTVYVKLVITNFGSSTGELRISLPFTAKTSNPDQTALSWVRKASNGLYLFTALPLIQSGTNYIVITSGSGFADETSLSATEEWIFSGSFITT